jgi:hypothetical protein
MNQNHETTPSVLDPVREVTIACGKISIKEMSWPKALKFLNELSKQSKEFVGEDGKFRFQMDRLAEVIAQAGELSTYLILNATDIDEAIIQEISFAEGCELLDAALSMNLTPEIMGKAKKVSGRFAQVLGTTKAAAKTSNLPPA